MDGNPVTFTLEEATGPSADAFEIHATPQPVNFPLSIHLSSPLPMLRVTPSYTALVRCLGLGLVFGVLALPASVRAQACEEELAEATAQYNSGRFDAVIQTLSPCA